MTASKPQASIRNVLCPSDLSERSQKTLGFAARLSEKLKACLTACHCAPANWFTQENRLPEESREQIKDAIRDRIARCQGETSGLTWRSFLIENSFDPARDILSLAREADIDLIVMKARPGVLSAFRFGSIVERIVEDAPCPVLLLPSRFLAEVDPATDEIEFRRILFDYDFSASTDVLFRTANALARDYRADLQVLSVLEPSYSASTEAAAIPSSRTRVQAMVRGELTEALRSEGKLVTDVTTAVEWGRHAESVLSYAEAHDVDLICTALAPPHFYFEKLYSAYLGKLLNSAPCPILVKQSSANPRFRDLPR
jgi:nucleotide-binding universal stress UspA family protein